MIRGAGDYLRTPLLVENRPGLNARVMLQTAVVCLILYAILIPLFHMWGAAAATCGAFLCMSVLSYREAQRIRRFCFESGRLLRVAAAGAASLLIIAFVRLANPVAEMGVSLIAVLVFVMGLLVTKFFTNEEKEMALRAWSYARGMLASTRSA